MTPAGSAGTGSSRAAREDSDVSDDVAGRPELLVRGDAAPHRHALPPVPSLDRWYPRSDHDPELVKVTDHLVNAVAECPGCGRLFVSRHGDDGWAGGVYWVPLRWWHRTARRNLRSAR